jgi:glycine oxidase
MIAVIGGGLAGTALAKLLAEKNQAFDWYRDDTSSASHISSGILNPVTGRRYATAWRYDELIAIAKQFYGEFLNPIRIEKHFTPYKEQSSIDDIIQGKENYLSKINEHWVEVKSSFQLQTGAFINYYTNLISEHHSVINQVFNHSDLLPDGDAWSYQGQIYHQVLFAEGIFVRNNPFFNHIDFRPNRGEALLLDIYTNKPEAVKKHGKFICPFGEQFWVGSSFDKVDFHAPLTTEKTKQDLLQAIPNLIEGEDYKVLNHLGALRSTTFDRRPIIGEHPQHKGIFIFNGFGTKGASLIPWCAMELIGAISNAKELNNEISILRVQ